MVAGEEDIFVESGYEVLDDNVGWATAMQIDVIDPDIISLADRLASFGRIYVHVPFKWPGHTFNSKSTKHSVQSDQGDDAINAGAHIDA